MAPCAEPGPRTPLCIVPFLPLLRQGVDVTCPGDWGGPGVTCPGLVPFTRWEKQVLPFNSREKRRGHGHSALGRGPSLSCSTLHVLASLLSGCVRAPSPASSASIKTCRSPSLKMLRRTRQAPWTLMREFRSLAFPSNPRLSPDKEASCARYQQPRRNAEIP